MGIKDDLEHDPDHFSVCEHDKVCVKCGNPKCINFMKHTILRGYVCQCGSSEWVSVDPAACLYCGKTDGHEIWCRETKE